MPTLPASPGVYLIHLHSPLKHARHYVGWSRNLRSRIRIHKRAHRDSCCFMKAVHAAGLNWRVVRLWPEADRAVERRIKNNSNVARLCPVCRKKKAKADAFRMRASRAWKRAIQEIQP